MDKPNWLLDIPSEDYHAATKDVEYISSHRLSIFRRCPLEYHKHITGEIPEGDTTTFLRGRMAHTLVLEGAEKFFYAYSKDARQAVNLPPPCAAYLLRVCVHKVYDATANAVLASCECTADDPRYCRRGQLYDRANFLIRQK